MVALELVLLLQVAIAILVYVARRIRVPYPILLVLGGLALGIAPIPGLPHIELEPDLVLLVFLPPLLYIAGYLTPFRDFRASPPRWWSAWHWVPRPAHHLAPEFARHG